jgi:quercetin dioxygenase-like cupin family protein
MQTRTTTFPDLVVVAHDQGKQSEPEDGLKRRVLAYNDKLFVAEHEMVKGWVGKVHSHPHDQVVYVVHGHLQSRIRGCSMFLRRAGKTTLLELHFLEKIGVPCRRDSW